MQGSATHWTEKRVIEQCVLSGNGGRKPADPVIAKYGDPKRQELLSNSGIVRNRLKIDAAIRKA